jgi:hypothetical protein
MDTSTSQLIETFLTSGGLIDISIPDGGGGWLSRKITRENLYKILADYIDQSIQTAKDKNKSSNFTKLLGSDVKLESIDFIWVSGTPNIKVGTSLGANDIISGRTPTSGNPSMNPLSDYFGSSTTLYFTITGGAVDIITNSRNNYNS